MLHLSANQRYFLFQGDTDMRKGFDSLSGIVTNLMRQSVLTGDIFIFLNRRNNHVKLLHWEGDGFALYVYYGDDGPVKTEHTGPVITESTGHFPMQC